MRTLIAVLALLLGMNGYAQTVQDFINQVKLDNLMTTVKELSGEQPTTVGGNEVTIEHRVSSKGNDLAAEYLLERLNVLNNLQVQDLKYSGEGRNIVAIQEGSVNPDDIYLICGHYDTVTDHGADDNASGVATILELAKILSQHCFENTIIYAFWDQEEIGLVGAHNYAQQAKDNGDNLKVVYNIDMMAYDNNNDNIFDIDYNDTKGANGEGVKDDILQVLNTYNFNLTPQIVPNSSAASDNIAFWNRGFNTVLVGESWETNDRLPNTYYHKVGDQIDKFNESYYHELAKLAMAFFATKGVKVDVSNATIQNNEVLTAQQTGATYQWIDCDTNTSIVGETQQTFTATQNGNYAVQVKQGNCTVLSDCLTVDNLSVTNFKTAGYTMYPNPVINKFSLVIGNFKKATLSIVTLDGKQVLSKTLNTTDLSVNVSSLPNGVYFAKLNVDGRFAMQQFIKK